MGGRQWAWDRCVVLGRPRPRARGRRAGRAVDRPGRRFRRADALTLPLTARVGASTPTAATLRGLRRTVELLDSWDSSGASPAFPSSSEDFSDSSKSLSAFFLAFRPLEGGFPLALRAGVEAWRGSFWDGGGGAQKEGHNLMGGYVERCEKKKRKAQSECVETCSVKCTDAENDQKSHNRPSSQASKLSPFRIA